MTGFECRRRSTLVERSVGNPDTLSKDCNLTMQSSSIFNQLPMFRLERDFGRRNALNQSVSHITGSAGPASKVSFGGEFKRRWRDMESKRMRADMDGEDIFRVLLVGDNPQSFSLSRQLLESN